MRPLTVTICVQSVADLLSIVRQSFYEAYAQVVQHFQHELRPLVFLVIGILSFYENTTSEYNKKFSPHVLEALM
jgi:cadmium resistance protein CadD (predicted permease)